MSGFFRFLFFCLLVSSSVSARDVCYGFNERSASQLSFFIGDSMYPSIVEGDEVFYRTAFSRSRLAVGDIVVVPWRFTDYSRFYFGQDTSFVVHRIVDIKHGKLYLKGDNNDYVDAVPVRRSNVKGVVCLVKR